MSLSIQVNRTDRRPIYLQIASQIKNQISLGRLPPGTRLPSVRQMAQQLAVNRLTVHNAYSELQADGWVESTVGRGTYVIQQAEPLSLLASIGADFSPSNVLRDLEPIRRIPTLRSLATTEPDMALAPSEEFWGLLIGLRREAPTLFGYELSQGDAELRIELARLLRERGVVVMPDDIMVTSGAMQGLTLVTQVLCRPGDTVIVEEPTYLGILHLLRMYGVKPVTVPLDDDGPDLDALEAALRHSNPRYFYTVPGFQNPTGTLMSEDRRRAVLKLLGQYDVPMLEDDILGMLAFDESALPAVRSMNDSVIYVSSVSKILLPGLRIGYVVAPPEIHQRLLSQRLANDLYGATFVQRALAQFLRYGWLKSHMRRVLPVYRERRDALLVALEKHMPPGVTWTTPQGGLSNWLTLPHDNMMAIYQRALQHGLAFTPGSAFVIDPHIANRHLRLCFSTQPAEEFDALIELLADLIRTQGDRDQTTENLSMAWTPVT